MRGIGWPHRLLALAAMAAALLGLGWVKGAGHVQARWDAAVQQQSLQTAALRERQAQATVKVVTEYVDRVRVVRERGDTIIKEAPIYVPVQADAACTINRGFVPRWPPQTAPLMAGQTAPGRTGWIMTIPG